MPTEDGEAQAGSGKKWIALNMDCEFSPGRTQGTPREMLSKLDSELVENSDGYLGSK